MELIIKPRGFGKTYELISIAHTSQKPILVATEGNREYIKMLALKNNFLVDVYTVQDVVQGRTRGIKDRDFLVDEVDAVFKMFLGKYDINPIIGTLTIGKGE